MSSSLPSIIAILMLLVSAQRSIADPPEHDAVTDLSTSAMKHRIVKSFDFDERGLGNFESVAMNWLPIEGPAYRRFLEARFDETVGHLAPPSFLLALQGGSLASQYFAKDVSVRAGSEYRLTAWIRPQRLVHARAYLTIYYLDHAMRKIDNSERRSVEVRGAGENEPWQRVVIDLPPGGEHARWIGLTCHVDQVAVPSNQESTFHPIEYHDVHGAAWFDDITILRLPRISLSLNSAAGIYLPGRTTVCTVKMVDLDGADLRMDLDILDADGRILAAHALDGARLAQEAATFRIADLPAGCYLARLRARVGDHVLSQQQSRFLRLNDGPPLKRRGEGGFGIVAEPSLFAHRGLSERLLKHLTPSMVKLPLWREDLHDDAIVRGDSRVEKVVEALHAADIGIVGVLEAPPDSLAKQYDLSERSITSILATNPNQWRPYIALILARYGQRIRAWQLGADDAPFLGDPALLTNALADLRREMRTLIGLPQVVIPRSFQSATPRDALPADVFSLTVPVHVAAERIAEPPKILTASDGVARWATMQQPIPGRYDRQWRLIHYARRLTVARAGGLDMVFVPQPWGFATADGKVVAEPQEEFIILRTLNQTLRGLDPAGLIQIGPDVWASMFTNPSQGDGALVVWREAQGPDSKSLTIDLGADAREIDLWGNVRSPESVGEGRRIRVDAMPRIIAPVSPARVRMLAGFVVDDPAIQATVREHRRVVRFTNTHESRISGILQFQPPPGWRIRPKKVRFDLTPAESTEIEIALRIPSNQAAGDYELIGHLAVESEEFPDLTLRTPLQIDSPGLDVNVMASREGGVVNVVQRITNRTDGPLNLRAFLIAPDQDRVTGLIKNLAAGQTVIRSYEVPRASAPTGNHIRVSVEQVGGPLRHNAVLKLN